MENDPIIESLGDVLYPNFPLGKSALAERDGMIKHPNYFTKNQITAFTLSMKSLYMLYNQGIQEARDIAMKALTYDVTSIDAYQTLVQTASFFIDNETKICLYRQLVSLYKTQYLGDVLKIATPKVMKNRIKRRKAQRRSIDIKKTGSINILQNNENQDINGCFTDTKVHNTDKFKLLFLNENENQTDEQIIMQLKLQPYFRLLFSLGETACLAENTVLAMQCYEEVLRFDYTNKFAANNLVISYIKVIGMRKRHIKPLPKRTMWHLKMLLNLYNAILDDEIKYCGNLILSYYFKNQISSSEINPESSELDLNSDSNGDIYDERYCWEGLQNWKDIAKEFKKKCPKSVLFIFMEASGRSKYPLIPAFGEWLDLVVDMHEVLAGKSETFYKYIHDKNKGIETYKSRSGKQIMAKAGTGHLDKAREALHNKKYIDGINECTLAKRMFQEANFPSKRWYLNSPFPILSNRASAALHLALWFTVQHDIRFTLMMNPKHQKSYLMMKNVALMFGLDGLARKMDAVAQKVTEYSESQNPVSDREWNNIAQKAIALLSLEAFALSKEGNLTDEKIDHLMKVGIEDCYCEIPCSTNLVASLPWINEGDD